MQHYDNIIKFCGESLRKEIYNVCNWKEGRTPEKWKYAKRGLWLRHTKWSTLERWNH